MDHSLGYLKVLRDFSENLRDANFSDLNQLCVLTALYCTDYLMAERVTYYRFDSDQNELYNGKTFVRALAGPPRSVGDELDHLAIPLGNDARAAYRGHRGIAQLEPSTAGLSLALDQALGLAPQELLLAPFSPGDSFAGFFEASRGQGSEPFTETECLFFEVTLGLLSTLITGLRSSEHAVRDPLTGVYNVAYFRQSCERIISENSRRPSLPGHFCVAMVDIDHFKSINDRFGHQAGDEVLVRCVESIAGCLRRHDILARYGGDELCIIFKGASAEQVQLACQRIMEHLAKHPVLCGSNLISPTLSIGISEYGDKLLTTEELIRRADQALYQSKRTGRNRCTLHQDDAVAGPGQST